MSDDWLIRRTKPRATHFGRAIPAFIHNADYYLATIDAYADGVIDCCDYVDIPQFRAKVASGWVVTKPLVGKVVSISNLGYAPVAEGHWRLEPDEIIRRVETAIRNFNTAPNELINMKKSGKDFKIKKSAVTIYFPTDKKPCLSMNTAVLGEEVPIFERQDRELYHLKRWFVFEDGSSRIGPDGRLENLEAYIDAARSGSLCTQVPDGALIEIGDLGAFRSGSGEWYVRIDDRIAEIRDLLGCLRGGKSVIVRCIEAFEAYQAAPSEDLRSKLREAYFSIPEHLRIFCGDMDNKDYRIRAVLYAPAKSE